MDAGDVMSYTATLLDGVTSTSVVIAGLGLSETNVTGSVSSMRFELSATCTSGSNSSNVVVSPSWSMLSSNANKTQMTVGLPSGGLSSGLWSVCVYWTAAGVVPTYVRVGAAQDQIEVGECIDVE